MVLRFWEDKIQRLETLSKGLLSVDSYLANEKKMLMEELELMREKVDHNHELTRFAMENIRLLDQIHRYNEFERRVISVAVVLVAKVSRAVFACGLCGPSSHRIS